MTGTRPPLTGGSPYDHHPVFTRTWPLSSPCSGRRFVNRTWPQSSPYDRRSVFTRTWPQSSPYNHRPVFTRTRPERSRTRQRWPDIGPSRGSPYDHRPVFTRTWRRTRPQCSLCSRRRFVTRTRPPFAGGSPYDRRQVFTRTRRGTRQNLAQNPQPAKDPVPQTQPMTDPEELIPIYAY